MTITQAKFDSIKKGSKISFNRGGEDIIAVAVSKPRVLRNGTLKKATFKDSENLTGCKYYMYCRENSISLAFGDMAVVTQNLKFI